MLKGLHEYVFGAAEKKYKTKSYHFFIILICKLL